MSHKQSISVPVLQQMWFTFSMLSIQSFCRLTAFDVISFAGFTCDFFQHTMESFSLLLHAELLFLIFPIFGNQGNGIKSVIHIELIVFQENGTGMKHEFFWIIDRLHRVEMSLPARAEKISPCSLLSGYQSLL